MHLNNQKRALRARLLNARFTIESVIGSILLKDIVSNEDRPTYKTYD